MTPLTFPLIYTETRTPKTDQKLQPWFNRTDMKNLGISTSFSLKGEQTPRQKSETHFWHTEDILERETVLRLPEHCQDQAAELAGWIGCDTLIFVLAMAHLDHKPSKEEGWELILLKQGAVFLNTSRLPWGTQHKKTVSHDFAKSLENGYIAMLDKPQSAHDGITAIKTLTHTIETLIKGRHAHLMRALQSDLKLPAFTIKLEEK